MIGEADEHRPNPLLDRLFFEETGQSSSSTIDEESLSDESRIRLERLRHIRQLLLAYGQLERSKRDSDGSKDPETLVDENVDRSADGELRIPTGYRLKERLGQGGFGIVLLAEDLRLHRNVAIKMPRPDLVLTRKMVQRFLRESRAVARLDHPNIVPVLGTDESFAVPAIIYHFVEGPTLSVWRQQLAGPLPPQVVARIGQLIAEAMHHAHVRGVLHRDLKPSNILLEPVSGIETSHTFEFDGKSWVPKITDFGLAKAIEEDEEKTISGSVQGTLEYMSPEQIFGRSKDIGTHSDVFSIGVVLFELLTGVRPFPSNSIAEAAVRVNAAHGVSLRRHRPGVPRDLDAIIMKCLRIEPEERYATSGELAEDLNRFQQYVPVHARRLSIASRVQRWVTRQPMVALLALGCFAFLCLGLFTTTLYLQQVRLRISELFYSNKRLSDETLRANFERNRAMQITEELRGLLFAADLSAAHQALAEGDLPKYRDLMDSQQDIDGEEVRKNAAWNYLWRRGHRQPVMKWSQEKPLHVLAYSPDNSMAAVGGQNGEVALVRIDSGQEVLRWNCGQSEINGVEFSPSSKLISTTGDDGTVRIWNTNDGTPIRTINSFKRQAFACVFLSDRRLVVCGNDPIVKIWNVETGTLERELVGHQDSAECIALSSDRRRLVSGSHDGTRRVWDLEGGQESILLPKLGDKIFDIDVSSDGRWLISGLEDGRIAFEYLGVQLDEAIPRYVFRITDPVQSVSIDPDGEYGFAATREGVIYGFKIVGSKVRENFDSVWGATRWVAHEGRIHDLRISRDGFYLDSVGADGVWKRWSLIGEADERRFDAMNQLGIGSDRKISIETLSNHEVIIATSNGWIRTDLSKQQATLVAESPKDCTSIVLGDTSDTLFVSHANGEVSCWDISQSTPKRVWATSVACDGEFIGAITYSAIGKKIVGGIEAESNRYFVLDAMNGTVEEQPGGELRVQGKIEEIKVSRDGKWVAVPNDRVVVVSEIGSNRSYTLGGHNDQVMSIEFLPDGDQVVTSSEDRTIRVWDFRDQKEVKRLRGHAAKITSSVLHEDGVTLASADQIGVVKLWHLPSGKELFSITKPSGAWLELPTVWRSNTLVAREMELVLRSFEFAFSKEGDSEEKD